MEEESVDQEVNVETKALLELMGSQEVQVSGEHAVQRENQEAQGELEHPVTLATLDKLALKELPALQGSKDHLELLDLKDQGEL